MGRLRRTSVEFAILILDKASCLGKRPHVGFRSSSQPARENVGVGGFCSSFPSSRGVRGIPDGAMEEHSNYVMMQLHASSFVPHLDRIFPRREIRDRLPSHEKERNACELMLLLSEKLCCGELIANTKDERSGCL